MTYEELTPDEKHYYNRLDAWRKERYLNTIDIVRQAMDAVEVSEKGLSHPRIIRACHQLNILKSHYNYLIFNKFT